MERSEKENKEYKRLADFNKNWKPITWVGKATLLFGIFFMLMGVYVYIQIIPRFTGPQGSPVEDLKVAYSLWCYTFVLLGLCTFITGYLLISYCRDVHFLFTLQDRGETPVVKGENSKGDGKNENNEGEQVTGNGERNDKG